MVSLQRPYNQNIRYPLLCGVLSQVDKGLSRIYGLMLALPTFRPNVLSRFEHRPPAAALRPCVQVQQNQTLILLLQDNLEWVQNAVDALASCTAPTLVDSTSGVSSGVSSAASRSGQQTSLLESIEQQWSSFLQLLAFDTVPTVVIAAHSEKTECGYTLHSPLERLDPKDLLEVFKGQA